MRDPRVLHHTNDYRVQNFPLDPRVDGRPRREGGKFKPKVYAPGEDISHTLSRRAFKATYAPGFDGNSVIEQPPFNMAGTGNRRIYHDHIDDEYSSKKVDGIPFV